MIEEKTVFIIGAGASRPYGYPIGKELREEICSEFVKNSRAYFEAKESLASSLRIELGRAETFVEKFDNSSITSIDLFLARNPEFMLMGKWAIIFRIFIAETRSTFREQMPNRNQDWYSYLFERLTDELIRKEDYVHFGENNVSFITFNYDRSLEHFLYESLFNSFNGIGAGKIQEQINKLRVIHVFGQIAGLDWQELESRIEYGRDINLIDIQRLADKLRIIYEEEENPALEEARELISKANRVFFLGFGYAKENCEVLKLPEVLNAKPRIYGTALDFTTKEIQSIRGMFHQHSVVHIHNLDSLALLREYL